MKSPAPLPQVALAYWARRLAARSGGRAVVLRSVDTDLALIAALHAAPGMLVQLSHFDRRTREMSRLTLDACALADGVRRGLRVSMDDWALICISRGTDFVARGVRGVPGWSQYVAVCAGFLVDSRATLVSGDAFDGPLAVRMLHSVARASRGGAVKADGAWLARLCWNYEYWVLAPAGRGAAVDPLDDDAPVAGWLVDDDGSVVEASAPLSRAGVWQLKN